MKVAVFDFDGTLYKKETFKLLMQQLKKHPEYKQYYGKFFRSILPLYIRFKMKLLPEHRMKEQSMKLYLQALESLTLPELQSYFEGMHEEILEDFNDKVVNRLQQHQSDGFHVLLVSGAYTPFLKAATSHLTFDGIIGTDIPINNEQVAMDESFLHIQGQRKNEQIDKILQDNPVDWSQSYAYGDSFSDLPVLEKVGNPVAVCPDAKLAEIAKERKWEIL